MSNTICERDKRMLRKHRKSLHKFEGKFESMSGNIMQPKYTDVEIFSTSTTHNKLV